MAEQAYAYVTLIPVAKGFQKAIAKELGGAQGVGQTAGKQTGTSFTKGFAGPLKGLAVAAAGALAAVGVGKFFKESISQASDLGESINAVNVAYGEYANDVLKLGDGVAKRLGLSTVDFNAAAVRFSAFAEKIAGQGGDVAGVVGNLSGRAADFASVFNIDVSEALQVFQSGLSGEAEPLKRFGINLLDSEVKAYAYANGITAVGEQLTETEKVQARYGLLLESTAKTAGDFANTSDGLANSQRILAASVVDLQAQVGERLTPVFATLTSALVPLVDYLFPMIASVINDYVAPVLEGFAQNVKRLVGQFTSGYLDLDGVLDRIIAKVSSFFADGGLDSAFQTLSDYRYKIFSAVLEAVPGIVDAFVKFLPQLIDFFLDVMLPTMLAQMQLIIEQLIVVVSELLPGLVKTLVGMIPGLLRSALDLFRALVDAVIEITPILIRAVVDLLPELIQTILDMLPEIIDASMELFMGIVEGLIDATPVIIDALFDLIPMMVKTLLGAIPEMIAAGAQVIGGFVKGIVTEGPKLVGKAIGSVVGNLIDGAKSLLGIRSPSMVFRDIGMYVGEGMANGITDETANVTAAATSLGDAAVNASTKAVEKIQEKFKVITNIPGMIQDGMEETVKVTAGMVESMLGSVDGLFAEFNEAGDLLRSYSGYGNDPLTDAFNSVLKYQGRTSIAQIQDAAQELFGGSMQQVRDAINPNPQATLINPNTGQSRTIGSRDEESLALAIERAMAEGFTDRLAPITTPIKELNNTIEGLIDAVNEAGLTPFASGGFVTGPTPALIGEAGPEVVMPLDRFERAIGLGDGKGKTVNYFAAPNQSLDNEQALFQAMRRAKVVANW